MVSKETERKLEELRAQIAQIEATAHREDLEKGIKKGLSDEDLYPLAKAFTNRVERVRKSAILEEARKKKAEMQAQAPSA